jgi:predicted transcriptional regulator
MTYRLTRTSMALDHATIKALEWLAERWGTSKASVIRRAVSQAKELEEQEKKAPKPLAALDWLQNGGGLSLEEAESFKALVAEERQAKRYWWES